MNLVLFSLLWIEWNETLYWVFSLNCRRTFLKNMEISKVMLLGGVFEDVMLTASVPTLKLGHRLSI